MVPPAVSKCDEVSGKDVNLLAKTAGGLVHIGHSEMLLDLIPPPDEAVVANTPVLVRQTLHGQHNWASIHFLSASVPL
jgi:hypothetical protein